MPRLPLGRSSWALGVVVAIVGAPVGARGQTDGDPLVLEGDVPTDEATHFFLPFEVPAGAAEIEVRHDDLSDENVLDWGLDDPAGHRGWGGGLSAPAIVGVRAASRGYVPGPLPAGTWRVVVGKALIEDPPGRYRVEIVIRDAATLDPQAGRRPYAPADALSVGPRWYVGDFHVHSRESGDARDDAATLDAIADLAASRGVDFVVISDHNVHTALDFFADVQARHPDVLLIPGVEFTTYAGHGNGIGVTGWQDHRIGVDGATVDAALAGYRAEGGLFSINHPVLDVSCIGCAWEHAVAPGAVDGVEIQGTAIPLVQGLFYDRAIAFWDDLLDRGSRAAALGGSDDHRAGVDLTGLQSPVGDPATLVFADELSVAGIVAGVRAGRTVVKLTGPDAPMLTVETDPPLDADAATARGSRVTVSFRVEGSAAVGGTLRVVRDRETASRESIDAVPFTHEVVVTPGDEGRRFRGEVIVDDREVVTTSYVWVVSGGGDEGGCRVGARDAARAAPVGLALALGGAVLGVRWRRGTRRRGSPG